MWWHYTSCSHIVRYLITIDRETHWRRQIGLSFCVRVGALERDGRDVWKLFIRCHWSMNNIYVNEKKKEITQYWEKIYQKQILLNIRRNMS